VSQRTRELAIRIALGATRTELTALVLRYGLRFVCAGIAAGIAGAAAATRLIANFVYGVRILDLPTVATVTILLTAVTIAACLFPARRALAGEPLAAIRGE
jgi:ABC-type antimicrobial peptide transport system permease subunit